MLNEAFFVCKECEMLKAVYLPTKLSLLERFGILCKREAICADCLVNYYQPTSEECNEDSLSEM